jgi:hypothetical protein
MRLLLVPLALTLAAQGSAPMTGEAFDAATRGKTIVYGTGQGAYGAEEYLPGHRVRWSFLDGDCIEGQWYVSGQAICFLYEDDSLGPQCWLFHDGPGGMTAEFVSPDGAQSPLVALSTSKEPLYCKGPKVGV